MVVEEGHLKASIRRRDSDRFGGFKQNPRLEPDRHRARAPEFHLDIKRIAPINTAIVSDVAGIDK